MREDGELWLGRPSDSLVPSVRVNEIKVSALMFTLLLCMLVETPSCSQFARIRGVQRQTEKAASCRKYTAEPWLRHRRGLMSVDSMVLTNPLTFEQIPRFIMTLTQVISVLRVKM